MILTVDEFKGLAGISTDTETYNEFILAQLPIVQSYIFNYIGHHFTNKDRYVTGALTGVKADGTLKINNADLAGAGFYAGCHVYLENSLANNGFYTVKSISSDTITIDDHDNCQDETSASGLLVYLYRADVPDGLKLIASKMIRYNLEKDGVLEKSIKSEAIGDYKVTYAGNERASDEDYPEHITRDLKSFQRAKFYSSF